MSIGIHEAAAEASWSTVNETHWNGSTQVLQGNEIAIPINRQQIIVMPVHIEGIELQAAAIVEGHVAADAVEWLPGCEYCRRAVRQRPA